MMEKGERENMRRIIITILAIAALISLCIAANFYLSFGYGGLGGFVSELKQPPDEVGLASLRSDAKKMIDTRHNELASLSGLTMYEITYSDMCAKGEHGWKRSDPFAYSCAYRETRFYGTNRDYKELLLNLEQDLSAKGWEVEGQSPLQPTISQAFAQYSGDVYLVELPDFINRKSSPGNNGYQSLAINSYRGYGVPWTKSDDEPSPFGFGLGIGQIYYEDTSNGNPEAIAKKIITAGQQPIMIAISRVYFSN